MKFKLISIVPLLLLITISLISCAQVSITDNSYTEKIEKERAETDAEFKNKEESILKAVDIESFTGLKYFDVDEQYKVLTKYELITNGEVFEMKTSTTRLPVYKKFAKLSFELDGKAYQLIAYQSQREREEDDEYKDYLFVPFTDLSNGESSYGGGRYIDIKITDGNEVELDFNTCYNPYCAYNDKYSCPIPPIENHLDIEIPAGVKDYGKKGAHAKH